MFEWRELGLPGVFEIIHRKFIDDRGTFLKTFNYDVFNEKNLECDFKEMFYSFSHRNVLRGMHFQTPPHDHAKLVHCLKGQILDVILDLRKNLPTYGKCVSASLSAENGNSIYIPRGLAHGFLSLEDDSLVHYSVTTTHSPAQDQGILWDSFGFDWGLKNPILSSRDQGFAKFRDFSSPFSKESK